MTNDTQWTWRWVTGLVTAGILIWMVQMTLALPSRVLVLENEKQNLWRKLDEMSEQLKDIDRDIERVKLELIEVKKEVKKP